MREFMNIVKALGDENRIRALMALRGGELCVCRIIEFLALAPSTVSKHMSILKNAGLVEGRKSGRWVYYRLAEDTSPPAVREAISWICNSISRDPLIREDERLLKKVPALHQREECGMTGKKKAPSCRPTTRPTRE
jgi:ArsR family transcriptional regulator, arsenate/arsenite/antimonite-responsive transcriptional repressor